MRGSAVVRASWLCVVPSEVPQARLCLAGAPHSWTLRLGEQ